MLQACRGSFETLFVVGFGVVVYGIQLWIRHIRGQARSILLQEWGLEMIQERRRKRKELNCQIFSTVRAIGMISLDFWVFVVC
jgi:hypothetical protein